MAPSLCSCLGVVASTAESPADTPAATAIMIRGNALQTTGQEEAREDLNADAAAAADAAVAKARETLASLQHGGSAAADYAAQKLGLASPSGSNTNK